MVYRNYGYLHYRIHFSPFALLDRSFVTKTFYWNDYSKQIPFLQKSSPSRIEAERCYSYW